MKLILKKHYKLVFISFGLLLTGFFFVGYFVFTSSNGEPHRTLPCGMGLKEQVLDARYGADMILDITITESEYAKEKEACQYQVNVEKVLLINMKRHGTNHGVTAEQYSDPANLPKALTVYDSIHNDALVRGRPSSIPPCESVGAKKLLFFHRLYIGDFIHNGQLHCRAAAYFRPITDKDTVLEYIQLLK